MEQLLVLVSAINGFVSLSTFDLLVGCPIGISCSAVGLKIRAISVAIKKYISIIKK